MGQSAGVRLVVVEGMVGILSSPAPMLLLLLLADASSAQGRTAKHLILKMRMKGRRAGNGGGNSKRMDGND